MREELKCGGKRRLAEEAAKLDPEEQRALAEEGLAVDSAAWPRVS